MIEYIDPLNQCFIQTDRVFAIRSKHEFYNGKCLYCGKKENEK